MLRTGADARALGRFVYQKRVDRFLKLRQQALANADAEAAAQAATAEGAAQAAAAEAAAAAVEAAAAAAAAEAAAAAAAREAAAQAATAAEAASLAAEGPGAQAAAVGRSPTRAPRQLLRSTTDVAASIDGFADLFAGEDWAAEDAGTGEEEEAAVGGGAAAGSTVTPEATKRPAPAAARQLFMSSSIRDGIPAVPALIADQPQQNQGFGQKELAAFLEARGAGGLGVPGHACCCRAVAAHLLQAGRRLQLLLATPPATHWAFETDASTAAACLQGTRVRMPFRCWTETARSG